MAMASFARRKASLLSKHLYNNSSDVFRHSSLTSFSKGFSSSGSNGNNVVVIGGRSDGYVAAIKASQLGLRTTCIQNRGTSDGTCLIVGCFPSKVVTGQVSLLHHSVFNTSAFQQFGISSSASPQPNEKETAQSGNVQGSTVENGAAAAAAQTSGDAEVPDAKVVDQKGESGSNKEPNSDMFLKRRRSTKRTAFSDSDSEDDLSMDDLVKLVTEKEELLKMKQREIEKMQDKVLRTYAEMENVMDRTRREAENSKKFAIQNFAKSLLDVADNLGRASSVCKNSFSKIDTSEDTVGAVPLLKTLLEGVEMTEKQLAEVFKKFGMEKYDPTNEQFDPHRHNAVFQISDPLKPPGTVAVVLKSGYMLYDRVLRPAEVGVTEAVDDNKEAEQGSEA